MQLDMTKGKILPVLLKFTIPLIIGNIFQQLYNMVDTIIVGRYVGANALAAVGSTGTIMYLIIGFSQGITAGFTILTSQRYGAHNERGVKQSVSNGILLSIIVSIILTGGSVLAMHPLLGLMNTPKDIFTDAYTYIMIISVGLTANVFYNLFSSYLRAVGNSKVPLFFLVFSACLNIVLDLLFIIHFQMGVAGAGWATNLSQAISAILCAVYIWKKVPILRPDRRDWKFSGEATRYQLASGIPMALQFAITGSGTMIMQAAINLFGSVAVAAFTASVKVESLMMQGMVAMGQTMATYCGQNYGSGDVGRIKSGVRTAVGIEVIYSIVVALLSCLLLKPCLHLFFSGDTDLGTMMPWAQTYTYMCACFFIPLCVIFIFRNAMQGCGYSFLPMMGGVSELAARLAVSIVAMHVMNYALACFADPAAWIAAGLFTWISYIHVRKKIEKSFSKGGYKVETGKEL